MQKKLKIAFPLTLIPCLTVLVYGTYDFGLRRSLLLLSVFTGQYFDAAKYFEKFHTLSLGKPHWCMDNGKTLHTEACNQLSLIYTIIANKFEASGERENYRYYLQLAYDKANEGRFIQQFVEMSSKTWFYFSFLVVQQLSAAVTNCYQARDTSLKTCSSI